MKPRLILLALAALAGCAESAPPPAVPPPPPTPVAAAAPPARATPDAPFREHPPAAGAEVTFVPPSIQEGRLKNGVRVLLVERHELPVVSVRVVAAGGAGDFPGQPPGLLSFMGSMLEQGTKTKSALELSDAFEAMGAAHSAWVDWDSGGASAQVTVDKLDLALGLLGEVILSPTFPQAEIDRLKARRKAAIQQEKNVPNTMWGNAAAASLYGRAHPYGNSITGREVDLGKLTRDAIVQAHDGLFIPARTSVIVAGDVTKAAVLPKLEAIFGSWRGRPPAGAASAMAFPKPPAAAAPAGDSAESGVTRVVWVDKPGAPQSVVRLAEVGVTRLAPDRDAIEVMNTILGGMFSSRINLNLREAHAFTYGAGSRFNMRHGPGSFAAGGNIVADKTAPAIAELFKEVRAIRDQPVSDSELATAKESIKRAMPGRFETVSEVTSALSEIAVYGLPLDEYATRPGRIDKITAEDVQKAAKAHLHPGTMKIVVVGDIHELAASMEPLHLGAVEQRNAYGDQAVP